MEPPIMLADDRSKGFNINFFELSIISSSVGYLFNSIYFLLAPIIWSRNPLLPLNEYTIWMRGYALEHDGVEVYALYLLVFLSLAATVFAAAIYSRITGSKIRYAVLALLLLTSGYYFFTLGFNPPVNTFRTGTMTIPSRQILGSVIWVFVITSLFYVAQQYLQRFVSWMVALFLVPICFIAIQPISMGDASYIFSPALRLLNGARISEVYFQYDLFLSFIAALWMKLNIPLALFTLLGQISYYALILGTFLFVRKFYIDQRLPVFLLIGMILVRIYGGWLDPVSIFQVTPLRLDLWFPLLTLIFFYGPFHWSVGFTYALLLLFHRNFGIIYTAAYCQLLLTVYGCDYLESKTDANNSWKTTFFLLFNRCKYNLLLIGIAFAINTKFFKDVSSNSENLYQSIGIGFIRISTNTFYWYLIILICLVFFSLLQFRRIMPRNYLITSFMLVYLAIGNSIYFFGRSHDHNIINISAVFVLLFFTFLDILGSYYFKANLKETSNYFKIIPITLALVFIMLVSVYYGRNIYDRVVLQYNNATKAKFIYPLEIDEFLLVHKINSIKKFTHNSDKVYFISFNDFLYYYYGHYAPVGYFSPFQSWLLNKDLYVFLNRLLDQGYYLVIENYSLVEMIVPFIPNIALDNKDGFIFVWKNRIVYDH